MENPTVLIIDDEKDIRKLLAKTLEYEEYTVFTAENAKNGLTLLKNQDVEVVICDVKLPGVSGIDLIEQIREISPETEIISLTAYGNIPDGIQAMKNGAFDYLVKGDDNDRLIPILRQAAEKARLKFRIKTLEARILRKYGFDQILGKSGPILSAVHLAQKVSPSDTTVLLTGPTGTGKEVFAHAIHAGSKRKNGPFVAINCGAIARDLLESEMFGHKAGAFTGAISPKKGLFEVASGGTIFLDEIGELNMDLQAKMLRVLESGSFFKVGETRETQVNVRIIAATNRNLEQECEAGNFREDLFYRLSVFQIQLPSLNERKEDIPLLAEFFTAEFATKTGKRIKNVSSEWIQALKKHNWKGNIRELRNVIERAVILCETDTLTPDLLPMEFNHQHPGISSGIFRLDEVEKKHIQQVLTFTGGNKTRAAELLGIGLTTLYRKIEGYGI
ncbi:MAG: sigma-54 dependent transcriptional regulator [Bacteroidia bacterium]|nr:sigma-54 dependent transcriptional regulator [Bacteroidia bacterium]